MVMITSMRMSRTYILSGTWQLIPMDHLFLSVYNTLLMLLLRKQVMMRTSIPLLHPQPLLLYILDELLELAHAN